MCCNKTSHWLIYTELTHIHGTDSCGSGVVDLNIILLLPSLGKGSHIFCYFFISDYLLSCVHFLLVIFFRILKGRKGKCGGLVSWRCKALEILGSRWEGSNPSAGFRLKVKGALVEWVRASSLENMGPRRGVSNQYCCLTGLLLILPKLHNSDPCMAKTHLNVPSMSVCWTHHSRVASMYSWPPLIRTALTYVTLTRTTFHLLT